MAINITVTDKNEVRIPVLGAITAGDLLINSEGVATKPSMLLSVAQLNNTAVGLSPISPITPQGTNYGDAGNFYKRFCENPNGDILVVTTGNGTTATTGVRLTTVNLLGTTVAPAVTVSSAVTCSTPRIKRLTSTTVLIAWTESSVLRFAIHNNDGTVLVAAATVTSIQAAGPNNWNTSVLTGGDIVFAYNKVTSTNCTFTRYNASGVLQGAETTVEAGAVPSGLCVQTQTSGGFVVYYLRSAATLAYKFARYNAAGVLQGALTTVSTGTTVAMSGEFDALAIELIGGNLVFQWSPNTAFINHSVYDSTGTLVLNLPAQATTASGVAQGLAVTLGGGFVTITGLVTSNALFRTFTASGAGIITTTFAMQVLTSATQAGVTVVPILQGFAIYVLNTDGTNIFAAIVTHTGVLVGAVIAVQTSGGVTASPNLSIIRHSTGCVAVGFQVAVSTQFATYNPSRTSILGVALESVADGAICRVGTKGTYTINQALIAGGIFDQRAATVQGTKGTLVGTTAVLYGLA